MTASRRVWRVGADIDTDVLAPGIYMKHGIDVIARHCLEAVRSDFANSVRPGDVLVADRNFGIGSSREQAVDALRHLGLAAVIAPSFSGLFFRNAFNLGLLLLTCPHAGLLCEGEPVQLQLPSGDCDVPRVIRQGGAALECTAIPGFLMDMVRAGGLLPLLQQHSRSANHGA